MIRIRNHHRPRNASRKILIYRPDPLHMYESAPGTDPGMPPFHFHLQRQNSFCIKYPEPIKIVLFAQHTSAVINIKTPHILLHIILHILLNILLNILLIFRDWCSLHFLQGNDLKPHILRFIQRQNFMSIIPESDPGTDLRTDLRTDPGTVHRTGQYF